MWNKTSHDFGVVKLSSHNTASFKYLGAANIVSVSTSCGCTTSTVNQKEVSATFTPSVFGENTKTVTVTTSDNVSHTLILKALVTQ